MEIRIGVQHAPRDVVLESAATPDQVRTQVDAALAAAGIDPLARGESLGIAEFVAIAEGLA